jgi:hypothetical protein
MLYLHSGILFFAAGNCLNFMSFAYAAQVCYDLLKANLALHAEIMTLYMGKSLMIV